MFFAAAVALAQNGPTSQQLPIVASDLFPDAQAAQQRGDLDLAASQYRLFLSRAQAELAEAYVLAKDQVRSVELMHGALLLSTDERLHLEAARLFLLAGKSEQASEAAKDLLHQNSASKELLAGAHQVLGRVLLQEHRDQDARREFEQATALDPTFLNGYDLAVSCLNLGDESCATRVFTEMQRSFGDTADLHVAFGRAYGNSDFQARAIAEFRRAIELNPKRSGTHYLLAAVLLADGGDDSARVDAKRELLIELQESPHDPLTLAMLGHINLIEKDYPAAEAALLQSVTYGPALPEGYLYLGQIYYNSGKTAEAEQALRTCIRLTSDPSRNRYQVQKAHYLLGRMLRQDGHPEEAQAELKISRQLADLNLALDKRRLSSVMELSTDSPETVAIASTGEAQRPATEPPPSEALAKANALSSQLRPAIAQSFNNLGVLAAMKGGYAEATGYFRSAFAWDPKLTGLDFNWGRAAFAANLYREAVDPLSRYVSSHPDDAGARSVLALSAFRIGNYQGCVSALEPVANKGSFAPQVSFSYAEALAKTGHLDEAIDRLTALASSNPGVGEIGNALTEAKALRAARP